jgi:protein-tyrosine phosphatase
LKGSAAFRDLGGAPTADGRRVAPGRLFRADALSSLDADDRAVIDALGLRLVCDLRGGEERAHVNCLAWLEPAPRRLHLELSAGLIEATAPWLMRLRRGPDAEAAEELMRTTYAQLPRSAAPFLGQLFDALVAGEVPALVHCTAGKDRTGFTIAMVLTALGVDRQHVYRDYLAGSGRDPLEAEQPSAYMLEALLARRLVPDEAHSLHVVRADYLDAAFDSITHEWGDPLAYLERTTGLDARRRALLQDHLLD